jgi:hypothetical protein
MSKSKILSSSAIPYTIIFIVLCILYLIYRYLQTSQVYESFESQNQTGLSVYFQNTVDSDPFMTDKNRFNTIHKENNANDESNKNIWDGIWKNEEQNINAQFIQRNDNVIISLSNYGFDYLTITGKDDDGCTNNFFIGRGKLNNARDFFVLTEIRCNTYVNSNLKFEINKFSGRINKDKITLYSQDIKQPTILTLDKSFTNDSKDFINYKYSKNYITKNDPFASAMSTIPDSNFVYEENFCENPEKYQPCIDTVHGVKNVGYNNSPYNACGTRGENGYCQDGKNKGAPYSGVCIIANIDGYARCKKITQVYDYMNFMPSLEVSKMKDKNMAVCNYLNHFAENKCNSCILLYVENIGNVQTLNYEFNGVEQNSLTVQNDVMNTIINKIFLDEYRELIIHAKDSKHDETSRVTSFINCFEENKEGNILSDILNTCIRDTQVQISNYKKSYSNPRLSPAIWELNHSLSNSCSFSLKTNSNYNIQSKYVQCNDDGSTSLSLFKGGKDQKMIFENAVMIKEVDIKDNYKHPFVAFTANIRAHNKLYLLPSPDNAGLNNNSIKVRLGPKPLSNGKWLIIGFSLSNLNDLNTQINDIIKKAYQ